MQGSRSLQCTAWAQAERAHHRAAQPRAGDPTVSLTDCEVDKVEGAHGDCPEATGASSCCAWKPAASCLRVFQSGNIVWQCLAYSLITSRCWGWSWHFRVAEGLQFKFLTVWFAKGRERDIVPTAGSRDQWPWAGAGVIGVARCEETSTMFEPCSYQWVRGI